MTFPAVLALAVRDRAVGFAAQEFAARDRVAGFAVPDKSVDFAREHFAVLDLAVPARERFAALDKSADSAAQDKAVGSAVLHKVADSARACLFARDFAVLDLAVPAMERFAAREFAALGKAADSAALDKSADFAVLHKAADSARARLFVRDFAVPDKVVRDRTVLGTAADPARKVSAVPDLDVLPARKGLVLHLLYAQAHYCRFLLSARAPGCCLRWLCYLHRKKFPYLIRYLFVHSFNFLHIKTMKIAMASIVP